MAETLSVSIARRWQLVDEADYLSREELGEAKHEYVEGVVYAMARGSVAHNIIASNVLVALGSALRGKKCRAFNSDMKVRIRRPEGTRYYYPDAMVVCRSNPMTDSYQDEPEVIIEVLSEATRRIDEDEKRRAHFAIPSLGTLVHFEQDARVAVVYRRTSTGFERTIVEENASIEFPEVDVVMSLDEVYEGVEL